MYQNEWKEIDKEFLSLDKLNDKNSFNEKCAVFQRNGRWEAVNLMITLLFYVINIIIINNVIIVMNNIIIIKTI